MVVGKERRERCEGREGMCLHSCLFLRVSGTCAVAIVTLFSRDERGLLDSFLAVHRHRLWIQIPQNHDIQGVEMDKPAMPKKEEGTEGESRRYVFPNYHIRRP